MSRRRRSATLADAGPLYAQLKRHIVAQILTGELGINARVPSENTLVAAFGVSRMTANRALRELTDEGYLFRVAGVGTFVADLMARGALVEVRNIADEVRARGHAYGSELLDSGRVAAPADVLRHFGLRASRTVYRTLMVHLEQGIPIQFEERFVHPGVVPSYKHADFSVMTPGEFLLQHVPLQEVEHTVRACLPSELVRGKLGMEPGEPCLLLERRTWSGARPVTLVRLFHPGTRFELSGRFRP